jgi:hypothetical protein
MYPLAVSFSWKWYAMLPISIRHTWYAYRFCAVCMLSTLVLFSDIFSLSNLPFASASRSVPTTSTYYEVEVPFLARQRVCQRSARVANKQPMRRTCRGRRIYPTVGFPSVTVPYRYRYEFSRLLAEDGKSKRIRGSHHSFLQFFGIVLQKYVHRIQQLP